MNKNNTDFADEILTMIRAEANNNPAPLSCEVIGNYNDEDFVDIRLNDDSPILKHIPVIGGNIIGLNGVLCFIDGDIDNMVVITGQSLSTVAKTGNYDDLINTPSFGWKYRTLTTGVTLYYNSLLRIAELVVEKTMTINGESTKKLSTIPDGYYPRTYVFSPARQSNEVIVYITDLTHQIFAKNNSNSQFSSTVHCNIMWHY